MLGERPDARGDAPAPNLTIRSPETPPMAGFCIAANGPSAHEVKRCRPVLQSHWAAFVTRL
jgi:hypothetical protein